MMMFWGPKWSKLQFVATKLAVGVPHVEVDILAAPEETSEGTDASFLAQNQMLIWDDVLQRVSPQCQKDGRAMIIEYRVMFRTSPSS